MAKQFRHQRSQGGPVGSSGDRAELRQPDGAVNVRSNWPALQAVICSRGADIAAPSGLECRRPGLISSAAGAPRGKPTQRRAYNA